MVLIKIISFIIYLFTALIADIEVINNSGSKKSSYIKTLKGEKKIWNISLNKWEELDNKFN